MSGATASRQSSAVKVSVFALDSETETAMRDALSSLRVATTYHRGGLTAAIDEMGSSGSPNILIVDISDCEPTNTVFPEMERLAFVVEPSTLVLAIGTTHDLDFYRQLTRGMNVEEFLLKPVTRDQVSRLFGPILTKDRAAQSVERGGRIIGVVGAKGGVGASMIASSLARYVSGAARRHTMLIDADSRQAACGLYLRVDPSSGLRTVLESSNRTIDSVLVDRVLVPVSDRLHMIASNERGLHQMPVADDAAARLMEVLRLRFNYVLLDLPLDGGKLTQDLLATVNHRILVMDPSVVALREAHKISDAPLGPVETQRPTVVLNRAGVKGGLAVDHITDAGEMKVDIEIPDVGFGVLSALNMGKDPAELFPSIKVGIEKIAREIGIIGVGGRSTRRSGLFGALSGVLSRGRA